MYLMDHVKFDPFRIEVGGKVLLITEDVVNCVIGLPVGDVDLPDASFAERKQALADLRRMCESKGMKQLCIDEGKNFNAINKTHVPRWIIERFASMKKSDDWTIQCFMMLVLHALLFPTTSSNLSGAEWIFCKNLGETKGYNWSKALVSDLKEKSQKWKKRDIKLAAPAVQGCVVFLIVSGLLPFFLIFF